MTGPVKSIETARAQNKWLYLAAEQKWMTPDELETANAKGEYLLDDANWQLRPPLEMIQHAQAERWRVEAEYQLAMQRVFDWQARTGVHLHA